MTLVVELPPELAPTQRAAVEALLAEVPLALRGTESNRAQVNDHRGACVVCHRTTGAMGGHHRIPGDNSSVVPVHPACHRRLHRKPRRVATVSA